MNQEERYRDVLAKRHNAQGAGVADYSGPIGKGYGDDKGFMGTQPSGYEQAVQKSAGKQVEQAPEQQAQQVAQSAQGGGGAPAPVAGSPLSTIGQAGMMSGNPYLMAGGLGLQVLAQGQANKQAEEEAQRKAYNDKIAARQQAMAQIASMGIA